MNTTVTKSKAEELRDNVVRQMDALEQNLRRADMTVEADKLHEKAQEYLKGVFSVMFTGAFTSGKSTTLNAMLWQRLLMTSINPETPVITRIINGEDSEEAVVKYRDTKRPDEAIPLSEFGEKYRLEFVNEGKFKEVSYVDLTRKLRTPTVMFVDSPGLGNNTTDDAVANDFAQNADAIVFLMNAVQAMDINERAYVERNFRCRHLKNVFFVVNWYNAVQGQDEEKFQEKLKFDLYDVFTDENGIFDEELYSKRVFCVDSYTSFCARTNTPKEKRKGVQFITEKVPPEDDQYSGIPEFEEALYEFLESDERDTQIYKGFMPRIASMFSATRHHMEEVMEQSKRGLSELESQSEEMEKGVKEIARNLDAMNEAIESALGEIMMAIDKAYTSFATRTDNNWDSYFSGKKIQFGLKEEAKIFGLKARNKIQDIFNPDGADKMARDREFADLMAPIFTQVETYIKMQTNKMTQEVTVNCEPIINRLAKKLQVYSENIRDVDLPGFDFDELVADVITAGKQGAERAASNIHSNTMKGTNQITGDISIAQALISGALMFNFDDMIADGMGGKKPWGTFIKETLLKELMDVVLATVISMIFPPAWIYYAARAIWGVLTMQKKADGVGVKILLGMKDATKQSIEDARSDVGIKVESSFRKELVDGCNEIIECIEMSLGQKQAQLQNLIEQIKDNQFDAEEQEIEFRSILADMVSNFNALSALIGGSTYTAETIENYAAIAQQP